MKIYAFADEASAFIDNQITAIKENGLQGLEIRNVDKVNVSDISDSKAREVRAKFDAAGLKIWSMGSPIGKIDIKTGDFPLHIEKFKRTLEIADILGAENIRMFSFYIPKGEKPEDYKAEIIDRLGQMCSLAKGSGITLCHENEKDIYGDIASRCVELHKALPSFKAVFDPANFVQCGEDTVKAFTLLSPYIKYMHIKDALSDGNVVPAGKGIANIPKLLELYKAQGGNVLTLEPHLTVFEGLAALEMQENQSVVGMTYKFGSNEEAFAAGADALKSLL